MKKNPSQRVWVYAPPPPPPKFKADEKEQMLVKVREKVGNLSKLSQRISKNLYSVYVPSCQICHNKAYEVKLWDIALT